MPAFNGNHRVCAALLIGRKTMRVRLLEPVDND